jgi:hypothetical protein
MAIENTPCYFDSNLENAHLAMGFPSNPCLIPRGSLVCGLPCEILHHPDGGMVKQAPTMCCYVGQELLHVTSMYLVMTLWCTYIISYNII